jgi:Transposase and inactivated derivatives
MAKAQSLTLADGDEEKLRNIIRTRTVQAQVSNRAKILLYKYEGDTVDAIAQRLGVNRNTVLLCIKKYKLGGLDNAIYDAPGRGRSTEISDDEKAWIISIACRKPAEFGHSSQTWTYARLTSHINETAEAAGYTRLSTITKTSIKNYLDEAEIKPFRIKYYCEKRDPDFERKMHDVLIVYKQLELQFDENGELIPFEGQPVHTISYDEKPGIQAIAQASPDRNPSVQKGMGTVMRDYEYIRLGTLSLLAGIDLVNGEAVPYVSETHKSSDFIAFLRMLDEKYPRGDKIRLILDNHSAHTSKETRRFLAEMAEGRFEFVFTPKHGSWLNMIEAFFSKMTRQMLRGIRVESKEELRERIYRYFEEVNEVPVVFHWKYHLDDISPEEAFGLIK